MQGRDADALLDGRAHRRGNQGRVREQLAPVNDPVPAGVHLDLLFEQTVLSIQQHVFHGCHRLGVVLGHHVADDLLGRAAVAIAELGFLAPDFLDQALGHQRGGIVRRKIVQLELQRRTTAIDDQYLHDLNSKNYCFCAY